jgi:hypothetical protein
MSLYGSLAEVFHGGNFGEVEPAEEFQIDDLGEYRIYLCQLIERRTELFKFDEVSGLGYCNIGRGNVKLAAALLRAPGASMVNDEPAHHTCCVGHKPRAIREDNSVSACHFDISLMKQCGSTNAHRHLMRELPTGKSMQFVLERTKKIVRHRFVATLNGLKKSWERG